LPRQPVPRAHADLGEPRIEADRAGEPRRLADDLGGGPGPAQRTGDDRRLTLHEAGQPPAESPRLGPAEVGQRRVAGALKALLAIELGLAVADEVDHVGAVAAPWSRVIPDRRRRRNWRGGASFNCQPSEEGPTMSADVEADEPETLPEEIVHWQPNHRGAALAEARGAVAHGASATGSSVVGALALGALALGAIAIGAVAIGALSIGRVRVRRARFGQLVVDDLVVRRMRILERG
jgi:hypothetical protein